MTDIDITGINKTKLLIALYAGANPQGMGYLQYDPAPMTEQEAAALMEAQHGRFDYVKGRVLKVNLSRDTLSPYLYDRDNGHGACASIVASVKSAAA